MLSTRADEATLHSSARPRSSQATVIFGQIYSSRETKSTATIIPTKSQATRLRLNYTMTGNSSIYWTAKTCSTLSAQSSTMQTFVMAEIHVRIEEMEN